MVTHKQHCDAVPDNFQYPASTSGWQWCTNTQWQTALPHGSTQTTLPPLPQNTLV